MGTMKIPYYPGCTLNTVAKGFDLSARESARALGFELCELRQWSCCGASFPLTPDNIIGLTSPAKVLIEVARNDTVVTTLCSVCYNVLKRTAETLAEDRERQRIVSEFMEEEYNPSVEVLHFVEILRDRIGFKQVKERVKRPLGGIRAGAYYGCMLLRPFKTMGIDRPEAPTIMEELMDALGLEPVEFPKKIECCGAHLAMSREDIVAKLSADVIESAVECGAELVVTSCPLCQYNLENAQRRAIEDRRDWKTVPIVYFTQLLGYALGQSEQQVCLHRNMWDARELFKQKGVGLCQE